MRDIVFSLREVHFSYLGRFPALCGVDAGIAAGEKVSVVGANGCGKSTFLHLLDGLIFADKGSVSFHGKELSEKAFMDEAFARDFRRRVGLVFQNPDVQLFCPTVREDIVFGPLQLGAGKSESKKRLDRLTQALGIGGLLERTPSQLSIGEKRKVTLASVLAIEPEVFILDEPTAGLDPQTSRNILDILFEQNAAGKTVIISTHDLHIVEEVSDTVYVLGQDRKIAAKGEAHSILSDAEMLAGNNLTHTHLHRHNGAAHIHPHSHAQHHGGGEQAA
jgi:cobalt/nickel transport system ATP-binding protein